MKQSQISPDMFVLYDGRIYQVNKITRKGLIELVRYRPEVRFSVRAKEIFSEIRVETWYEIDYTNFSIKPVSVINVEPDDLNTGNTRITLDNFHSVIIQNKYHPSWHMARDFLLSETRATKDHYVDVLKMWRKYEKNILAMEPPK